MVVWPNLSGQYINYFVDILIWVYIHEFTLVYFILFIVLISLCNREMFCKDLLFINVK